jgi:hypothetical protein
LQKKEKKKKKLEWHIANYMVILWLVLLFSRLPLTQVILFTQNLSNVQNTIDQHNMKEYETHKTSRDSTSPTFSNCLTRSLTSNTDSGGLSALTADISKHGYPSPQMLHKQE